MCGPMAMLGLVGAGISAMGSIYSANAQAAGLKAQAQWQKRQAGIEMMKTNYEINQMQRQTQALLGEQVLAYSAQGIDPTTGSPIDIGLATVQERGMDVQARRFQGQEEVNKLRYDAKMSNMQAQSAKTAGMFGALSSIVGGVSQAFGSMGAGGPTGTSLVNTAFSVGNAGTPQYAPAIVTAPPLVPMVKTGRPLLPNPTNPATPYSGGAFLFS